MAKIFQTPYFMVNETNFSQHKVQQPIFLITKPYSN